MYKKHFITDAIGHCSACGESLTGPGLAYGPLLGDVFCPTCVGQITALGLADERTRKYLADAGLIDNKGRVVPA